MGKVFLRFMTALCLTLFIISCDDDKKDPDSFAPPAEREISSEFTADISNLVFQPDSAPLSFYNVRNDAPIIFTLKLSNAHPQYPLFFSLHKKPDELTFDPSSTCKMSRQILQPNEICYAVFTGTFPVNKDPAAIEFTDNYDIKHISFTVTPIGAPSVTSSLSYINFGSTSRTAAREITITADANDIKNSKIENLADSSELAFTSPDLKKCNPLNNICTFTVLFHPSKEGSYNSFLNINDKVKISLTGFKPDERQMLDDLIIRDENSLDVTELSFGEPLLFAPVMRKISLTNASANGLVYSLSDIPDGFSYGSASTCGYYGGRLDSKTSCDYFIIFQPSVEKMYSGNLNIKVADDVKSIPLTGKASSSPVLTFSDTRLDFGKVSKRSVDNCSVTKFMEITNMLDEKEITLKVDNSSKFVRLADPKDSCKSATGETISFSDNVTGTFYFALKPNIGHLGKVEEIIKLTVIKKSRPDDILATYYISIKAEIVDTSFNTDIFIAPDFFDNFSVTRLGDYFVFISSNFKDNATMLYDYKFNEWQSIPSSTGHPEARTGHAVARFNNSRLYLFGGKQTANGTVLNDLWSFDTRRKTWKAESSSNAPLARSGHQIFVHDGKIYVHGGADKNGGYVLSALNYYDMHISSQKWGVAKTDGKVNIDNNTHLFIYDNKFYKIWKNKNSEDILESYDINGGTAWQSVSNFTSSKIPLSNASSVVIGDVVYIHGAMLTGLQSPKSKNLLTIDMSSASKDLKQYGDPINEYLYSRLVSDGKRIYIFYTTPEPDKSNKLAIYNIDGKKTTDVKLRTPLVIDNSSDKSPTIAVAHKHWVYFFSDNKIWRVNTNNNTYDNVTITSPFTVNGNMSFFTAGDNITAVDGDTDDQYYIINTKDNTSTSNTAIGINFADNKSATYMYDNVSDKVYLYGGKRTDNTYHTNLIVCDTIFNSCDNKTNDLAGKSIDIEMKVPTDNRSAIIDNGTLYAFDGINNIQTIRLLDNMSDNFTLSSDYNKSNYKLFVTASRLYIIGGEGSTTQKGISCDVTVPPVLPSQTCDNLSIDGDAFDSLDMRSSAFVGGLLYKYDFTKRLWSVITLN